MEQYSYRVDSSELPKTIEYFEQLIGKKRIKNILGSGKISINKHYWYIYIKNYKDWIRNGAIVSRISHNMHLMRFAMIIKMLMDFEDDIKDKSVKDNLRKRLCDNSKVESTLFEFRTGLHYKISGLNVHWLPNIGDEKEADLEIITDEGNVLIECLCRIESFGRILYDDKLMHDFIKGAEGKLDSKHDYYKPRMIVVRIPEEVDWGNELLKYRLNTSFDNWFKQERVKNVNVIFFLGGEKIVPIFDDHNRRVGYKPDQIVFFIKNPEARYKLPSIVEEKLAQPF